VRMTREKDLESKKENVEEKTNGMEVTDFNFSIPIAKLLKDSTWNYDDLETSVRKLNVFLVILPIIPGEKRIIIKSDGCPLKHRGNHFIL
jgi:hypothetical protein